VDRLKQIFLKIIARHQIIEYKIDFLDAYQVRDLDEFYLQKKDVSYASASISSKTLLRTIRTNRDQVRRVQCHSAIEIGRVFRTFTFEK
jgi:hypothetical protein